MEKDSFKGHVLQKNMEKDSFKGHVLLCPYPAQGHITPTLQFAKRLASKGLKITLATTPFISRYIHIKDFKLGVETFSDTKDDATFIQAMHETGWRALADIINKYNNDNSSTCSERITCLVCDAVFPQFLDAGKEFGLVTAAFYTQSCSVSTLFYHVKRGNLTVPVEEPPVSIPGLPLLDLKDLPSSVVDIAHDFSLSMLSDQFSNLEKADWLLFNTFDSLESKVLKLMGEQWRVRAIGPATPSMYLDKRIKTDTENSFNMFKPSDDSCIEWLNGKEVGSVLYISFGSIAQAGEEQMEEVICGVKEINKDFIWVIRETERSKLPEGFAEEMRDKGLLVTWCLQLEVLAHEAVRCFLTHCGWNSTMEALSLGVPMVAMPFIWDQFTNAKFVEDVWGLGIRARKDDSGIVTRGELVSCIREIMEGARGKEIKTNLIRWRGLAKDAVDEGGNSDLNIVEFVASITSISKFN